MFAVPGWSVSADKLKAETLNKPPAQKQEQGVKGQSTKGTGANATALFAEPAAKKRKREKEAKTSAPKGPEVTSKNLAEMWERVIEKREPSQRTEGGAPPSKKSRRNKNKSGAEQATEATTTGKSTPNEPKTKETPAKKNDAPAANSEKPAQSTPIGKPKDKKEKKAKAVEAVPEAEKDESTPKSEKKEKAQKVEKTEKSDKTEKTEKQSKKEKKDKKKKNEDVPMEDVPAKTKEQTPSKKQKADKPQFDKLAASPAASSVVASPAAATVGALSLPPIPAGPKLTPLQASMRAKLVSARFRHLNETLYTTPSEEALRLFGESPDMFHAYHEGFRQQVSVWPENPVDGYVAEVRRRAGKGGASGGGGGKFGGRGGRGRGGRGGRGGFGGHHHRDPTDTLPRTRGQCRLADIGCGDARLAASLAPDAESLRIEVLSFDLHADPNNPFITAAADASDLPLGPGSVDVTVFCLALMGTNWLSFIEEAYRVLRWKGELWVAEIKSRFAGGAEMRARLKQKQQASQKVVSHSVGFRRKNGIKGGKKGQEEEDPDVVAAAITEVDGADEGGSTGATDVSAFVQALRRRGFVLDESNSGEDEDQRPAKGGGKPPAVDLSNKMFVKMRFIKAAPPTVGKEEVMNSLNGGRGGEGTAPKKPSVFDDDKNDKNADPMADPALEAKILKPCVYKLR